MAVSSTPVREALARLSGEGLIERARSGYLTRAYDPDGVRELYELDLVYALASSTRSGVAGWDGSIAVAKIGEPPASTHVARTETLLRTLSTRHDRTLAVARQRVWDRLAPFRAVEPSVLPDAEGELVVLAETACQAPTALHAAIRAYYRKRARAAAALLASASARKYQSNIP